MKWLLTAGLLWTLLRGSIDMDTIQFMIWRNMPARTCGRRNVAQRFMFLIDSLAPRNSRTGNHQIHLQIQFQKDIEMLNQGSSSSDSGKTEACPVRWGRRRHASGFQPGVRDFRWGTMRWHSEYEE